MKHKVFLLTGILFILWPLFVLGGQGFIINKNGDPVLWDASSTNPIKLHPESGACGQFNNTQMITRLESNLEEWSQLSTVDLDFNIVTGVIKGVDGCNYSDYLAGVSGNTAAQNVNNIVDSINPILFDNDGNITDLATGENNGRYTILGFSNPDGFSTDPNDAALYTGITDGQAVFNCYCLEDAQGNPAHSDCVSTFTVNDKDFTMIHELGHFMNLDHTQINDSFSSDADTSNDENLPTMYPISVSSNDQKIPHEDDIVALSSLYPTSDFFTSGNASSHYCKVTGTLLDQFGQEMRCADIQAIESLDDFNNVAFVSGAYAPAVDNNGDGDSADSGECTSNCGDFTLYLKPGKSYTIQSESINSSFKGGSGISPCALGQLSTCTSANITACTDSSSGTTCRACVQDETLTTNDDGDDIAAKIASDCTAGATVALGNITGNSVSSPSAATQTLIKNSSQELSKAELSAKLLPVGQGFIPLFAVTCPESSSASQGSGCSMHFRDRYFLEIDWFGNMVLLLFVNLCGILMVRLISRRI